MIRFLKRHVWPWAEIERLKDERDAWRETARFMSELSMHCCKLTNALVTAAIWALFLIVIPPVSAVCWAVVWWSGE